MRRTLYVNVSAKERDYLIRVLRGEQANWLRCGENRERNRHHADHEQHVAYVLDARSRADAANCMAIRVSNAKTLSAARDMAAGEKE